MTLPPGAVADGVDLTPVNPLVAGGERPPTTIVTRLWDGARRVRDGLLGRREGIADEQTPLVDHEEV